MSKAVVHTQAAPAAIGPYSQAVQAGSMLFTSGQLGLNPATGELASGVEAQADQAMRNLGEILKQAGMSYANIVKTTVFVADLNDFSIVNAVYQRYFDEAFPARSCVQVAALPKGALVEIECIAIA
ncbi:MAG: RidA family protein [Clostridiales bacterium]|nr:RidA family protein [Clostridiales bacterium]MDY4008749.1 RidA family protein [Candidatus Limiplasma sp.]